MTDRIAKGTLAFNNAWRGIQATIGEVAVSIFASVTGERGPVEAMRAFDKWLIANAPQILKAFSNIATKVIEFSEAFVSVVTGVDSADPKIRAIAAAFGSWGVTLERVTKGLQIIAGLLAANAIMPFFAMLAALFGGGAAIAGGGAVAAIAGIAAAMGAGYLAYSGVGKALGAGDGKDAPAPAPSTDANAPANAPAPDGTPAPANVGIGGEQPQKPAYGPGSNVDIAGPAGAADYKGPYTGPGANLRNKGGAALLDRYRLGMAVAMDELRKQGMPEDKIRGAAAILIGNASAESELIPQTRHEAGGTGYGIYGADPSRQQQMFKWLAANGYDRASFVGQVRQMVIASKTHITRRGNSWAALQNPNIGYSGRGSYEDIFESPQVNNNRNAQIALAYRLGIGGQSPAPQGGPQPAGDAGTVWKPRSVNSPQIQALLRQYGMGGDARLYGFSSKYQSATGFENAPGGSPGAESSTQGGILPYLKRGLYNLLGGSGLRAAERYFGPGGTGEKLHDYVSKHTRSFLDKNLGGGAEHGASKAFSALSSSHGHAFAADHLKTTPMGAGHQHLMNRSNVHAPTMHSTINIHGVNDSEAIGREAGFHQKRLWSGLTRNTTTTAS